MNWRRVLVYIGIPYFFCLVLPGQFYHLTQIILAYTANDVITVIEEDLPDLVDHFGLNVCVRQNDFETVLDAWMKTPSVSELLVPKDGKCGRIPCKNLVVRKYFFNGYTCFVIEYYKRALQFLRSIYLAKYGEKSLIKYWLNTTMLQSDEYIVFMADFDQPAIKYFEGKTHKLGHLSGRSFTLSAYSETKIMLEGYKGDCLDYRKLPAGDKWKSFTACLHDGMVKDLNMSLPIETIYSPLNQSILNTKSLKAEQRKVFNRVSSQCSKMHSRPACYQETIITDLHEDTRVVPQGQVLFTLELPSKPNKISRDVPRMEFEEFVSFIQGSFGSWLSINVLSFFPPNVYDYFADQTNRQHLFEVFEATLYLLFVILSLTLQLLFYLFISLPLKCLKLIRNRFSGDPAVMNVNAVVAINVSIANQQNISYVS